jgi:hypothetical protein
MWGWCRAPVSRISAIRVICVDKDAQKIEALHRGEMPIFEPGLDALVATHVRAGRLVSQPILPSQSPRPTPYSSLSVRRHGVATATPT